MAITSSFGQTLLGVVARAPYPIRQNILGTAYMLIARRRPSIIPLLARTLADLPRLGQALLPRPEDALELPDGLCGLAGRIGVAELLEGYADGMFVLSHIGPLKWWAPQNRMTLFFDQARVEKTVRRLLRNRRFRISFDTAFETVMKACAEPRDGATPLTWITPRIRKLFAAAHAAGHAHSVEIWEDNVLVGGVYGLAVGGVFFTESQFHTARDASKVGFAVLNRHLQAWGFASNDGKHPTRYLGDCGMRPVTRAEFTGLTRKFARLQGRIGKWAVDEALLDDSWNPPADSGLTAVEVLPGGTQCPWSVEELLSTRRSSTW